MNSKVIIGVVVVALLIGGAVYYNTRSVDRPSMEEPLELGQPVFDGDGEFVDEMIVASPEAGLTPPVVDETAGIAEPVVKSFTITGSNFQFSPAELRVKQGDTVRLTFVNGSGVHDWKLDEFSAATKVLQNGEQETIEFVADRAGEFEYYCSVGNHREMGMKGTLIVE